LRLRAAAALSTARKNALRAGLRDSGETVRHRAIAHSRSRNFQIAATITSLHAPAMQPHTPGARG
jgi:hypothetical protein